MKHSGNLYVNDITRINSISGITKVTGSLVVRVSGTIEIPNIVKIGGLLQLWGGVTLVAPKLIEVGESAFTYKSKLVAPSLVSMYGQPGRVLNDSHGYTLWLTESGEYCWGDLRMSKVRALRRWGTRVHTWDDGLNAQIDARNEAFTAAILNT